MKREAWTALTYLYQHATEGEWRATVQAVRLARGRAQLAALPDPAARAAHLQHLATHFLEDLATRPASEISASLQNAGLGVWIQAGAVSVVGFRE